MPLQSGSSPAVVSRNIRELHSGKTFARTTAKFGKLRADKQAVAIALAKSREGRQSGGAFNMAREPHIAAGGLAAYPQRAMMRSMVRGALLTPTPGRADAHRTSVPSGSYVIPADVVSGRGQGNTLAGAAILHKMFGMGPYGGPQRRPAPLHFHAGPAPRLPSPPRLPRIASGGGKEGGEAMGQPVPVNLSGGEVVVPPENLLATFRRLFPGRGYSLPQIHAMMDRWILDERKHHRRVLAKLPGPAKD